MSETSTSSHAPAERAEFIVPLRARILLPFAVSFFAVGPVMTLLPESPIGIRDISLSDPSLGAALVLIVAAFLWAAFGWFVFIYIRMLRYYREPFMFALTKGHIEAGGKRIARNQVTQVRWRAGLGDVVVESKKGRIFLHPQLTKDGVGALKRSFRRKFDHKGFNDVVWLVGN